MEIHLDNYLPEYPSFVSGIRRAPDRGYSLYARSNRNGIDERFVTSRLNYMRSWLLSSWRYY